jgi:plastocyanin domain-containing protein
MKARRARQLFEGENAMNKVLALALTLAPFGAPLATGLVAQEGHAQPAESAREIEVVVEGGYTPSRITVREGERVRLRFVRHEDSSCTREVVFPSLGLRRELPPHQPVLVELPPLRAGEYDFHCGMGMVHGTLVVVAERR